MGDKYNGWTNYETWNAALWIDNSESDQNYWREVAEEIYKDAEADKLFSKEERAALDLSERLKDSFEELAEQWMRDQASFFADIFNAALSEVNWHEVAEHILEPVTEDA